MPTAELITLTVNLLPWSFAFLLGMLVFRAWRNDRVRDRHEKLEERHRQEELRLTELERLEELRKLEEQRREEERSDASYRAYIEKKEREESAMRAGAGGGTGGYIVVDLPDAQRSLFQDLLKGFEEYAQLKGYQVAFSADTTFAGYIAFKFTLTNPDVVVSGDRVRKDLKEYIEKVSSGEALDDIPRIVSVQEHEVLVATLKNRISFLQHSFNLAKTSAEFYERLLRRTETLPVLPQPSVVVQTGGTLNAPTFSAVNSPQALLGMNNSAGPQIFIAQNYTERKVQIDQLDLVLERLSKEPPSIARDEATRVLANTKEELESATNPEPGRVSRWIQRLKELCQVGSLGAESVSAAKELFKVFGIGS